MKKILENNERVGAVYWIHLPGADIKTDGYVGITSRPIAKRWKEHVSGKSKSYYLMHAIEKYGDQLVWDIIFRGPMEGCSQLEEYWRPSPSIGWNIRSGGNYYIMAEVSKEKLRTKATGREVSQETKLKLSLAGKGRKHSEEHKAALSLALKITYSSTELRERQRLATLKLIAEGKVRTDNVIPGWNKGIPSSEETKKKLSEFQKMRCNADDFVHPRRVIIEDDIQNSIYEDRKSGITYRELVLKYGFTVKILTRVFNNKSKMV